MPFFILKCLAFGFFFYDGTITDSQEIQQSIVNMGIRQTIIKYCELDLKNRYDNVILDMVIKHYDDINQKSPISINI